MRRSLKVKMQGASPERARASKAKGNEIESPEATGAAWCTTCSAQQTPCHSLSSLTLTFLQAWLEHPEAAPAPSVTMALVESHLVRSELWSQSYDFFRK